MTGAPAPEPRRSRTVARVAAVQALYQCEQNGDQGEAVIDQFRSHRLTPEGEGSFDEGCAPEADRKLFKNIVRGVTRDRVEIDEMLVQSLPATWPLDRLDPVLRAVMRAGIFEISNAVPVRVVINEYLDVAHGFFSGDESKLLHGILDAIGQKKGGEAQGQEVTPPTA